MLRLVYCKKPGIRSRSRCRTHNNNNNTDDNNHNNGLDTAFFHLINQRLDIGPLIQTFYPVLLAPRIQWQTKSYLTYLALTVLGAVSLFNTALDLFCLLLTLTSGSYRAYTAIHSRSRSSCPLPLPMTGGKRRRASEGDVVGTARLRRAEIDQTTRREQGKRKREVDDDPDDDHPSPSTPSSTSTKKKPRFWSFHPADVHAASKKKKTPSRPRRFVYRWVPRRPPWYTLRVCKRYAPVGKKPKRRKVRYYSERQVRGLEGFLAMYDPPFNAFCLDDLRDSLPVLSPLGTEDASKGTGSASTMPSASESMQPLELEEEEEEEEEL